jgi:hypothetical protein
MACSIANRFASFEPRLHRTDGKSLAAFLLRRLGLGQITFPDFGLPYGRAVLSRFRDIGFECPFIAGAAFLGLVRLRRAGLLWLARHDSLLAVSMCHEQIASSMVGVGAPATNRETWRIKRAHARHPARPMPERGKPMLGAAAGIASGTRDDVTGFCADRSRERPTVAGDIP